MVQLSLGHAFRLRFTRLGEEQMVRLISDRILTLVPRCGKTSRQMKGCCERRE